MFNPHVKAQYERYPYPPRNPADETRMLFPTGMDQLDRLNHHVWGGARDLSQLKVLVAGGGTGDATVYLAEQLSTLHPHAQPSIVHLDLSRSSLEIAQARVKARGLSCVHFVEGSLLQAEELLANLRDHQGQALVDFDYINCSGVLHHLSDPDAGLRALREVLAPEGAMGIMLYGQYGRTGVYQMQELLRSLFRGDESPEEKVELCKKVISSLPPTNWFARQREQLMDLQMGDAAIYDLLLHPQDRAYTVGQVYDFLQQAELQLVDFVHLDGTAQRQYDPNNYWSDPPLQNRLAELPLSQRQGVAELAAGNMLKHSFYCTRKGQNSQRQPSGSWIPDFSQRYDVDGNAAAELAAQMRKHMGEKFTIERNGCRIVVRVNPRILSLIEKIDGQRSLDEIVAEARRVLDPKQEDTALLEVLARDLNKICEALGYYEWVFLRAPHCPRAPRIKDLQIATVRRLERR